ncbi:MAG: hypothetical protein EBU90_06615 [Proteobacteria bacterium]|nr:hypothetical protein [Pseudomonadota bacterium]NBP15068.1 hypothetical protein [bacterium]
MSDFLPATQESKFSNFSYLINNNFYDFRAYLASFDGRIKGLSPSSIKVLKIEDNIDQAFHSGYVILDNRQDNIESNYTTKTDQSDAEYYNPNQYDNTNKFGTYIFNGDCRDIFTVQILPKVTETGNPYSYDILKYFLLTFDFVVYNTEEIDDGSQDGKLKKLYLKEYAYEVMREKNSYFSTANYINSKNVSGLSNADRKIPTGAALSSVIAESLDPNDGFEVKFGEFDAGSTSIYFSAPADFKCIDSLHYILARHVSGPDSNFDPCLLQLERYPKEYTLKSIKSIFENAVEISGDKLIPGQGYLETYKVPGFQNLNSKKPPTLTVEYAPTIAPYFKTIGNIDSYSFDTIAGEYSQLEISSKAVHFYDFTNKNFEIDSYRNNIEEFLKAAKENYINNFSNTASETFQIGNFRKFNKNLKHEFTIAEQASAEPKNQRLSLGLAKNLYNYVFLNNFITFRVPGSTHRQAGKFIGITRDSNKEESLFDNKFLGIYFIVSVNHVFQDASYFNDLVCVKTYLQKDLFLNKNIL